jgi:ubiquinone biosynthesis protein COQ4
MIELRRALRAVGTLIDNPDDTAQVFALIEALTGVRTPSAIAGRLRATDDGRRLLDDRPEIVALLMDRGALRRQPDGSLAHAYLRFVESEAISADGLRRASSNGETGGATIPAEVRFVRERMRDTHDLWHAVLGYRGDVLGEAALLAFTFAQTGNSAVGVLALVGIGKLRSVEAVRLIVGGFRRGLRAEWFPGQRWESLLALPLDEVRRRLRVHAPTSYQPIRSDELRAAGLLRQPRALRKTISRA